MKKNQEVLFLIFKTELMAHQEKAVDKLSGLKVGALYMDTGTGKTRTALELGLNRLAVGKVDCLLWLCPVSVKQTITKEIEKHTLNISYEMLQPDKIKDWNSDIFIAGIESTSQSDRINFRLYELVQGKECFIIVDESSLIKNPQAKRTQNIWRLGEQANYKLILNGTPLSNGEEDLFAQWYFLDQRILGYTSYYSFAANHLEIEPETGRVLRAFNKELLSKKIAPYTYQIKKSECLDLPDRTYSTRYYNMGRKQEMIYQETMQELLLDLDYSNFEFYSLFNLFTALQKVVSGLTHRSEKIFDKPINNPRIKLLLNIIGDLPDEKIIIWCKYQHEINSVVNILSEKFGANQVAEFWGELSETKRNDELDNFENEARFLVANKECGAFGLNLQFCSYAIYYSNNFTWATRYQSEDRIYRAGQENNVHIIDIVCNNTIDERIQESLMAKQSIVNNFRRNIDKFKDKDDLERWLSNAKKVSRKECVSSST